MTEEDIAFGIKDIPLYQNDSKKNNSDKRKYGNKYQKERTNLSFRKDTVKDLDKIKEKIKEKKGIKVSYPDILEYLIELENMTDPLLENKILCKKCGDTIDLPSDSINYQRVRHNDLNKSKCNGTLCEKLKIKKDLDGIMIIGNKLYHKHEDKKDNSCPFCKNKLKDNDGLTFKCTECNKEFEFVLKEKIDRHDTEEPYGSLYTREVEKKEIDQKNKEEIIQIF